MQEVQVDIIKSGGSITHIMKKFKLNLQEPLIQKYVTDILHNLVYLHNKGIIHRDIKGANIIVDFKGVCKLADFGCSIIELKANQLKGTPLTYLKQRELHQHILNLKNFLDKCLHFDHKKRWKAKQLLQHPFIIFMAKKISKAEYFTSLWKSTELQNNFNLYVAPQLDDKYLQY